MSVDTIRSATETILGTIAGIKNIRDYDMYVDDEGEFDRLYRDGNELINCCELQVRKTDTVKSAARAVDRNYRIKIVLRRTRSEKRQELKTFETLVENVHNEMVNNTTLSSTVDNTEVNEPSEIFTQRFGNEPQCLHCEIDIDAEENVTGISYT